MPAEEGFTAEEQAAWDEMQSDDGSDDTETGTEAPENNAETGETGAQGADTAEGQEAAQAAPPAPEWDKLTDEQREGVRRFLDGKAPPGFTQYDALHAERSQNRELKKRLEALEAQSQGQQQEAEQPPQFVDPLIDPEGFRKWAEHERQSREQVETQQRESREQQQRQAQRMQRAQALEQEFAAKTPDYGDAVGHLHQQLVADLRSQGLSDAEIGQNVQQQANRIFDAAEAAGLNPAELLYQQARRSGYRPKQPAPSEADKMAAQAKAQSQTQGLGNGGGEQGGGLTAEALGKMSEAELAKVSDEEFRRVMGG